jgi:molecular chaperone GrpE
MIESEKDQTEKEDQKVESQPEDQKSSGTEKTVENDAGTEKKADQPKDGTEAEKTAELTRTVEELTKENADLKDQLLRRAADFDNYRKRILKEKQDAYDYANEKLLQDLLDSLDNFDRTVDAAASAQNAMDIADGVRMINNNLVKLLEDKYNLSSYGNPGDRFNPDEHQAIGSEQGAVAEPVLKEVYLKGYKLKDKVIRHAKVMVTMPDGTVEEKGTETKADTEQEKK